MFILATRRFLPLFLTQFFGAFNDNLLKNALIILITYKIANTENQNPQELIAIAAALFILPFFLFSALAGQIADKYNRAKLTRIIKFFEIIIMALASLGFITQNIPYLITILFACGVHSAFFGPIKYALLPQHLPADELLNANGYVEAGTFIAILIGTIGGGVLIIQENGHYWISLGLLLVSLCGYIASTYIPTAAPPMPNLKINFNLFQETLAIIKHSHKQPIVFAAIICISWFWFIGATFLTQMPIMVKEQLHAQSSVVSLFLTIFSVGIAIGSLICHKILKNTIQPRMVTIASIAISIFIFDFSIASNSPLFFNLHALLSIQQFFHIAISWRVMFDLFAIAILGGLYIVPLYALIQYYGDKNYLARIIATNNIINALFMVLSAFFILLLITISCSISATFLMVGIINLFVAIYAQAKLTI